jgi:hypothetical protein
MTYALNLFASGIASLASVLVPARVASAHAPGRPFLPTNTPTEAVAGDLLRVGAQVRMAQEEKKKLMQSEFSFSN